MKKLLLIIGILFISIGSKAQRLRTYADTANYLIAQIENKKAAYIGKSFSVLYDSLKIKPVYVLQGYSPKDVLGENLDFEFNFQREFSKAHFIIICFETWPSYSTLYPLLFPGIGKPIDMNAVAKLYKPLIVKDIIVKDYQQDEPVNSAVMLQKE